MNNSSGVGVLDKTVSVLSALESGPASLAQLVKATGLARPTAHRIAVALETHRMLARDAQGRFVLGPRIGELAAAAGEDRLLAIAQPILTQLGTSPGRAPSSTGRTADTRICVAAAERTSGLRDTVPVGAALPMTAGSAAQVLLAWEEGGRMHRGLRGAKFTRDHAGPGAPARLGRHRGRARARRRVGVRSGPRARRTDPGRRLGIRADRAPDQVSRADARRGRGRGRGEDQQAAPRRGVTARRRRTGGVVWRTLAPLAEPGRMDGAAAHAGHGRKVPVNWRLRT